MKLTPYRQVDDIAFSVTPADLRLRKGSPLVTSRNGIGLEEMDYGDSVFRFQDGGQLEEVTKQASVIQLPNAAVPVSFLGKFLRAQDSEAFERGGFVVSPRFGLAFAPQSPGWVTALAQHCIDAWRAMR